MVWSSSLCLWLCCVNEVLSFDVQNRTEWHIICMGPLKHSLFEVNLRPRREWSFSSQSLWSQDSSVNQSCALFIVDFTAYYLFAPFQIYFCHLQYQLMKFITCLKQVFITFAQHSFLHPFSSVYTCYRYVQLLMYAIISFTLSPPSPKHTHSLSLFPSKVSSMLWSMAGQGRTSSISSLEIEVKSFLWTLVEITLSILHSSSQITIMTTMATSLPTTLRSFPLWMSKRTLTEVHSIRSLKTLNQSRMMMMKTSENTYDVVHINFTYKYLFFSLIYMYTSHNRVPSSDSVLSDTQFTTKLVTLYFIIIMMSSNDRSSFSHITHYSHWLKIIHKYTALFSHECLCYICTSTMTWLRLGCKYYNMWWVWSSHDQTVLLKLDAFCSVWTMM